MICDFNSFFILISPFRNVLIVVFFNSNCHLDQENCVGAF